MEDHTDFNDISGRRLVEEWKIWRKDHPSGIEAQPLKNENGNLNLRLWQCFIPGPRTSEWEGARYRLILSFPYHYPVVPPKCQFAPPLFHPNVLPSGEIVLPELCKDLGWRSDLTIDKILLRIQEIFLNPNIFEGINQEAVKMYLSNYGDYQKKVRSIVKFFNEELN